jgi:hypothetical protein
MHLSTPDSEKEEDKTQHPESTAPAVRGNGTSDKNAKEVEDREPSSTGHEDETRREQTDKEVVQTANGTRQPSASPPDSRKRKRKGVPEKVVALPEFITSTLLLAAVDFHLLGRYVSDLS